MAADGVGERDFRRRDMYCWKCGASNPDNATTCSACGQVVAASTLQEVVNPPATNSRTSRCAIAALVLGILSPLTCMVTTLPAVICGIVALVKISGAKGRLKGTGMAIAGLAVPIVVLPVMALAMGIMMPALARVRQVAFRMTCGTNLSGIAQAMGTYADGHDGRFPAPAQWCDTLVRDAGLPPVFLRCRGVKEGPCNYAMNPAVEALGTKAPPDMVLLFETAPGWNQVGDATALTTDNHQQDGCNVLFVDGHVEFVKPEGLNHLRWTADPSPPGSGFLPPAPR
jgi:prepilin-type processing-associated H-X9-DG protein